jgi:hypothetical protein
MDVSACLSWIMDRLLPRLLLDAPRPSQRR